jgi:hypothetical protein
MKIPVFFIAFLSCFIDPDMRLALRNALRQNFLVNFFD